MNDIKETALSLLKNRDKTESEVTETLIKKGFEPGAVGETVEYLKDMRYIDDFSYATRYIEMSMEKMRGPLRISRELKLKGIDDDLIDDVLAEVLDDQWEWDTADLIVEDIKSKNPSLGNDRLLVKIINKLTYEGFSDDVISDVTERLYES